MKPREVFCECGHRSMTDWKNDHANEASKAVKHPICQAVIEELIDNLGVSHKGLPAYGIRKVALYAAQVARAQALGFDPDLLRVNAAEANDEQRKFLAAFERGGVPVVVVRVKGAE